MTDELPVPGPEKLLLPEGFGHTNVVAAVRAQAARRPGHEVFTFLSEEPGGTADETVLTYAQLDGRARALAVRLRTHLAPGSRALLLLMPGEDFVVAFFGCLYAGVIAVPTYLPLPGQRTNGALRLAGIAEDCRPEAVLTTSGLLAFVRSAMEGVPEVQDAAWLAVDTITATITAATVTGTVTGTGLDAAAGWSRPGPEPGSVAFLQYTSGSTGAPKGVVVTHANLLHNAGAIDRSLLCADGPPVIVGWLPPYHDMGLISMIVLPAVVGARSVLMSPVAFLQRPVRWLRALTRYRGTASAAPHFAFDLCVRKIPEEERAGLDLSALAAVANGGEPVHEGALRRFSEAFGPYGFRPEALVPVYGLAEATLLVSGQASGRPPTVRAFDGAALEQGTARAVEADDPAGRPLVGCGVSRHLEVLIVDPERRLPCPPGRVGEIWVSGTSVAAGYWQRPALSEETFGATVDGRAGTYLRTGDLGFRSADDGELFVTGRIKDLIILGGRNHYPQDIERTAETAHPAVRPGCVAAFGVRADGPEEGADAPGAGGGGPSDPHEAVVVAVEIRGATGDGPAATGTGPGATGAGPGATGAGPGAAGEERGAAGEGRGAAGEGRDAALAAAVADAVRRAVLREHLISVREVVVLAAGSLPKTSSGKLQRGAARARVTSPGKRAD
ncbi:fatty acyl-AMP ligase [Streptomyces sp. NPDC093252]|uniref:fatty acyl-AMP ligase n=1 Tax=Streptomyces sp. NPDC093252 TaxID=3154980 RepID=UPI0034286D01